MSRWVAVAAVVGVLLSFVGIFMYNVAPDYIQKKIKMGLSLQETSPLFESWVEPDVPMYVQFYFLNVLNPQDIQDGNMPVRLQQMGPYTFSKRLRKTNITFDYENNTVSYIMRKIFNFEPSLTNGSLSDSITTPNIPLMALGLKTENQLSVFETSMLNQIMRVHGAKLFVKHTIGEMLFDGYFDSFMNYLSKKKNREFLPNGKFGFLYQLNETGPTYLVNTGVTDSSRAGVLAAWSKVEVDDEEIRNGSFNSLTYWNDTYCDAINGTDGSRFYPPVTKDLVLRLFSDELCRSIHLRFKETTTINGIPVLRFTIPKDALDDSIENSCYCSGQYPNCLGSGFLNISKCSRDAPIALSPARFYQLGPEFMKMFPDLNTSEDLNTYLDIEPMTGLVIRATKKVQVNVILRHYLHVKSTKNLKQIIFPLFWINETIEITPEKAALLNKIIIIPQILNYSSLALMGLGGIILLLAIECAMVKSCRRASSSGTSTMMKPIAALPSSHFVRLSPHKVTTCSSTQAMLNKEGEATSGPL